MLKLFKTVFDIFYPLTCGGCGRVGKVICDKCIDSFRVVEDGQVCPVCGRHTGSTAICGSCMAEKKTFARGYFGFYFEGPLREVIHSFKFKSRRDAGRALVGLLAERLKKIAHDFDCVVPLPVTEKRLYQRGFNQSYIIGEEIAGITEKELLPSVLHKVKTTEDQYTLSREGRKKNVRGAFAVKNSSRIRNKRVLLVDDLFTTGYTAREASRVLLRSSAGEVVFFGLARTPS